MAVEVLREELERGTNDIIKDYVRQGMKASGKFAQMVRETIEVSTTHLIGEILGPDYAEYMKRGRGPGKMPMVERIELWLQQKGIRALNRKITQRSLAWAIAKNIAKKGTETFQKGGSDFVENVFTAKRIEEVFDRVASALIDELVKVYVTEAVVLTR